MAIMVGYPNRADTATLSGGSWSTSNPLDNAKDRLLGKVARSTDDANASTKILADLGASYTIRAVSLHAHNLSSAANVRVMLGTSSGGSEVYDSTSTAAYTISYDSNDPWPGADYTDIIRVIAGLSARYVTVEIDDTANPDTYVEVGRIGAWSGFLPTHNASYGLRHDLVSRSILDSSYSDVLLYEKRKPQRSVRFSLNHISDSESHKLHSILRRADDTDDILFMPDTASAERNERYGFLGTMRKLEGFERAHYNINEFEIELLERV